MYVYVHVHVSTKTATNPLNPKNATLMLGWLVAVSEIDMLDEATMSSAHLDLNGKDSSAPPTAAW